MTTNRTERRHPQLKAPNLPLSGSDGAQSRYMIAAILAAGKDGCTCEACQYLKQFSGELIPALLKEVSGGGDQPTQ